MKYGLAVLVALLCRSLSAQVADSRFSVAAGGGIGLSSFYTDTLSQDSSLRSARPAPWFTLGLTHWISPDLSRPTRMGIAIELGFQDLGNETELVRVLRNADNLDSTETLTRRTHLPTLSLSTGIRLEQRGPVVSGGFQALAQMGYALDARVSERLDLRDTRFLRNPDSSIATSSFGDRLTEDFTTSSFTSPAAPAVNRFQVGLQFGAFLGLVVTDRVDLLGQVRYQLGLLPAFPEDTRRTQQVQYGLTVAYAL